MAVFQLLYFSRPIHSRGHISDLDILRSAMRRNAELGVTGFLARRQNAFIQLIEGKEETIRALLERIRADRRHSDLVVVLTQEVPERTFGDWSMAYSDQGTVTKAMADILQSGRANMPDAAGLTYRYLCDQADRYRQR